MKDIYGCIRRALITEKSNAAKQAANQVVFEVSRDANKIEIKQAVQKLFNVKVLSVNVMNYEGKRKRIGRYRGTRPDWKKAVVTLKKGETLEFFEGV
ncbi:MAG: 50S ribosomal protein L23 [Desulfobacterota bacterium]|nr:50S ribosomal protein L23 [Thermodesulfobacteriota bacterium]